MNTFLLLFLLLSKNAAMKILVQKFIFTCLRVSPERWSSKCGPIPTASVSSGILLAVQIFGLRHRPTELETLGMGTAIIPGDSDAESSLKTTAGKLNHRKVHAA